MTQYKILYQKSIQYMDVKQFLVLCIHGGKLFGDVVYFIHLLWRATYIYI